jgi:hypothetical protein
MVLFTKGMKANPTRPNVYAPEYGEYDPELKSLDLEASYRRGLRCDRPPCAIPLKSGQCLLSSDTSCDFRACFDAWAVLVRGVVNEF